MLLFRQALLESAEILSAEEWSVANVRMSQYAHILSRESFILKKCLKTLQRGLRPSSASLFSQRAPCCRLTSTSLKRWKLTGSKFQNCDLKKLEGASSFNNIHLFSSSGGLGFNDSRGLSLALKENVVLEGGGQIFLASLGFSFAHFL